MKIPHLTREGSFRSQMREAIAELKNCDSVQISLTPTGGYKGDLTVLIEDSMEKEFETNLELSDATRFPARIRAAATELREQGFTGTFRITHDDGTLTISNG